MKLKTLIVIASGVVLLATGASMGISSTTYAQQGQNSTNVKDSALKDCSDDKCDLVRKYINPIIAFLTAVVGLAVVGAIIFGGIRYAASEGDPQKAAAAKAQIRGAIIALVCFMFLYAAINWLVPGDVGDL